MPESNGLVYNRRGSGVPLLLVHGLGSRKEVWNPIAPALAERRDVIAVDLPGFGSSAVDGPGGVYRYVDRVATFVDDLGLDKPEVAGNSMGGAIALELGRRGVVSKVTAVSPIGFWTKAERIWCQQALSKTRALGKLAPLQLSRVIHTRAGGNMLRLTYGKPHLVAEQQKQGDLEGLLLATGFDDAAASFAGYDFERGNELDDVAVTVAWGTRDALLFYRTQAGRARAALPKASHVVLRGSGHVPFADDPAGCVDAILG